MTAGRWGMLLLIFACLVLGSAGFSNRSQLRAALLLWHEADEPARLQLAATWGRPGQWDVSKVTSMKGLFDGLFSLDEDVSAWNTSSVVDMSYMFRGASSFNQHLGSWDTSSVESMKYMFEQAAKFNKPLRSWNTSSVRSMEAMFRGASAFDQPVGEWDTSRVESMKSMFNKAVQFNHPLGSWNTSSVSDMTAMFDSAAAFDQPIGSWDTSHVKSMGSMFYQAVKFNQSIGAWNVSSVTDLSWMFGGAAAFDQPIGMWNTALVKTARAMFCFAVSFNSPLGSWNTSSVVDMTSVFMRASAFNQPIGEWDTSSVKSMQYMFAGAASFNQPIGAWNTSSVSDISGMFYNTSVFNQYIGTWDTSSVKFMQDTFHRANAFNQAISAWDTSGVESMKNMFAKTAKFNRHLYSWNTSSVKNMAGMFEDASAFNEPVNAWDTSRVKDMSAMFHNARVFNQALDSWNTSSVKEMVGMFMNAAVFNQPIDSWDTSSVVDMNRMFAWAVGFNQAVCSWDTSAVLNMSAMFMSATSFNHPVGTWDTSSVRDMTRIFNGAASFNQPISTWDFTSILDSSHLESAFASGMSSCTRYHSVTARGLPRFQIWRSWAVLRCPVCPCFESSLACVDGTCQPVNSGFVDLSMGRGFLADFHPTAPAGSAVGFRQCAAICRAMDNCSAFLLEGSGCHVHLGNPPAALAAGDAIVRQDGFLKMSCSLFSCPPGSSPLSSAEMATDATAVVAAACCVCSEPSKIRNISKFPELECISCPAGTAPSGLDSCQACPVGRFAAAAATHCEECGAGYIPTDGRDSCESCSEGEYSESGRCNSCTFPSILYGNTCFLWHLPTTAAFLLLASAISLYCARQRRQRLAVKREQSVKDILCDLEQQLWDEKPDTIHRSFLALSRHGWTRLQLDIQVQQIRAWQSPIAGVGLDYLLTDFLEMAQKRSAEENPTFNRLKEVFWYCADPLGADIRCPRDGEMGCALVDWIPPRNRRAQTHFLSWTWKYTIMQVHSALNLWQTSEGVSRHDVFFYMCFFVNNQHRIILGGSQTGSDNLEDSFRSNLLRLGRVVAILDTWHKPVSRPSLRTTFDVSLE